MAVKHLVENVRDIALVGHRAAGKTSLADALLFEAHAVDRLGSVDDGTSVGDFDEEEHKHHFSIDTHVLHADHDGKHLNILDAPGSPDFIGAALEALSAVETAVVVVSAVAGIEVNTRRMFQEDIDRVQEFHKCIECFLCQNVCHVIRDHEDNKKAFSGPRHFVRLAALEMHPLDSNDRMELIKEKAGIGYCNITKCCTEVCPEHIHITDNAIIPLKERVVDRFYDPVAKLLGLFSSKTK